MLELLLNLVIFESVVAELILVKPKARVWYEQLFIFLTTPNYDGFDIKGLSAVPRRLFDLLDLWRFIHARFRTLIILLHKLVL